MGTVRKRVRKPRLREKRLKLDQTKIDFAKKLFGVDSDQEAVSRALSLIAEEAQLTEGLKRLKGALKDDHRPWPYTWMARPGGAEPARL